MNKKIFFPAILAFFLLFGMLTVFNSSAAPQADPMPSTEIYQAGPGIGVTSTLPTAYIDGVFVTTTQVFEGKTLLYLDPVEAGVHTVVGDEAYTVLTADLFNGTTYTNTLGVSITANNEPWGRTGVVEYPEGSDERLLITVTGFGYNMVWPPATLFWNYELQEWTSEPVFGYYTAISVPLPPPTPTPTNTPTETPLPTETPIPTETPLPTSTPTYTPEPVQHVAYLPLISNGPPECVSNLPFTPFYWQSTQTDYTVCSKLNPGSLEGYTPVSELQPLYNWKYPLSTGWLQAGGTFNGQLLEIKAGETGIGIVEELEKSPEGYIVYAISGQGYQTIQTDWGDDLFFWNFETKEWQSEPNWGEQTIIGVLDN